MDDPELLLTHRDFVHAVARALVHDGAAADDVAQETLVAAWRSPAGSITSPRGFLATLATNFARQFRRGEQRRASREQRAAASERVPSVHEIAEREERRRAVVAAVLSLAVAYRDVLLLRYYEALPPRAIARRLDVPVETVRTRLKRGIEQIRARLVAAEQGDSRALLAWLLPLAQGAATPIRSTVVLAGGAIAALLLIGGLSLEAARRAAKEASELGQRAIVPVASEEAAQDESSMVVASRSPVAGVAPHEEPPAGLATVEGAGVTGVVVDARGTPLVGAEVLAWPDLVEVAIDLDDAAASATRPRAISGADGAFALPLPEDAIDGFTLFARREGYSAGVARGIGVGRSAVRLVLEDAERLVGRVVDRRGDGIAGATVRALALHGGAQIERRATSDAAGAFDLEAPLADRAAWQGESESWRWWIEASAPGFAPRVLGRDRTLVASGEAKAPLEIVLLAGASCRGRIVAAQGGAPVAGARVVVVVIEERVSYGRRAGGSIVSPYRSRVLAEARSDESGAFRFDHLPARSGEEALDANALPEMVQLFVLAPGFAIGGSDVPLIDDGGGCERTIELWRAATITGRVVDRGGAPIGGVRVALLQSRGTPSRAEPPECVAADFASIIRTDAAGAYRIDGVGVDSTQATERVVTVDDPDWTSEVESSGVRVSARAGEAARAPDLVAVRERSVVLEVVDSRGVPIAGANVTRWPQLSVVRRTDAKGRLVWCEADYVEVDSRGLARRMAAELRFHIARAGYASRVTAAAAPSVSDPPLVRIELMPAHVLEGEVLDPLLRPSPYAFVRALRERPTDEEYEALMAGRAIERELLLSTVACDSAGRFRLDDLPNSAVVLLVSPLALPGERARGRAKLFTEVPLDGAPFTVRLDDD